LFDEPEDEGGVLTSVCEADIPEKLDRNLNLKLWNLDPPLEQKKPFFLKIWWRQ